MKIENLLLIISIFLINIGCNTYRNSTSKSSFNKNTDYKTVRKEDGKCFAKSFITNQYNIETQTYAIYTGDIKIEKVEVETIEVETEAASTEWIKKRADRNCLSSDPNDCLVWCLVEKPAMKEIINVLKDTTQSKNYELKQIEIKHKIKNGGFTEWRQVLCESERTNLVMGQLQQTLIEKGYYSGVKTNILDEKTKTSLMKFQKENGLPIGQLDHESLDMLGVTIN